MPRSSPACRIAAGLPSKLQSVVSRSHPLCPPRLPGSSERSAKFSGRRGACSGTTLTHEYDRDLYTTYSVALAHLDGKGARQRVTKGSRLMIPDRERVIQIMR